MTEHWIDGEIYIETDDKPKIGDLVISSEKSNFPRVYEVYHVSWDGVILGNYSTGHTSLNHYKVLKLKEDKLC